MCLVICQASLMTSGQHSKTSLVNQLYYRTIQMARLLLLNFRFLLMSPTQLNLAYKHYFMKKIIYPIVTTAKNLVLTGSDPRVNLHVTYISFDK
jgi:hypothetical protein